MGYFQAKSDLKFIEDFRKAVLRVWEFENKVEEEAKRFTSIPSEYQSIIQKEASKLEGYQKIREQVAKGILRADRIAHMRGIPIELESYPAPAIGGPIIPIRLFHAILRDTSHGGIDKQWILDALNQTNAECEEYAKLEYRRLINPAYWIKEGFMFIIRIPFMLINVSGFDVSKIEDHFFAKVFKLLEIIALIYILIRFGIQKEQVMKILMLLIGKGGAS